MRSDHRKVSRRTDDAFTLLYTVLDCSYADVRGYRSVGNEGTVKDVLNRT